MKRSKRKDAFVRLTVGVTREEAILFEVIAEFESFTKSELLYCWIKPHLTEYLKQNYIRERFVAKEESHRREVPLEFPPRRELTYDEIIRAMDEGIMPAWAEEQPPAFPK